MVGDEGFCLGDFLVGVDDAGELAVFGEVAGGGFGIQGGLLRLDGAAIQVQFLLGEELVQPV